MEGQDPSRAAGVRRLTGRVPLSIRKLPYRAADRAIATRDGRRLQGARPDLVAAIRTAHKRADLRTAYDHYVAEISNWEWAVSWPTVMVLDALCEALRPRRILDLGSGFSTYVECSWARRTGAEVEIVSVDDSPDWLEKTRAYLAASSLTARLIEPSDLPSLPGASFDLAFDDIGRIERRASVLEQVVRLMKPGAVVVLDDMNVLGYRRQVQAELDRAGWNVYSLRHATIDAKGRFAMVATVPRTAAPTTSAPPR